MNRNPVIPFYLIMAMGLVLMFFLGIKGVGDAKEIAKQEEGVEEEVAEFEPEAFAQQACIACHGENLEGQGDTPGLYDTGLSQADIADVLINGQGTMPGGLVPADNVDEMAEWVANLK